MTYALENESEAERLEWQATLKHYNLDEEMKGFSPTKGAKILDAGCGSGLVSRYIAQNYAKENLAVHGIDFSEIRVQQAKNIAKENQLEIKFSWANLEGLEFEDDSFDHAISRYVFQHLPNPYQAARELYRVIKPDGKIRLIDHDGIFINLHTANTRFNQLMEVFSKGLDFDLLIGRKMPAILKSAGFKNISYDFSGHSFQGEELKQEVKNATERLQFAHPLITQIFGDKNIADEFSTLYLEEMVKSSSVLFHNRFIVNAVK